MLADTEPLRNLGYRISTLGDLGHRIALELITEVGLPHRRLLSSKLGKKASTNLGAIHTPLGDIHARFGFIDDIIMPHAHVTNERRIASDAESYPEQLTEYETTPKAEHLLSPEFVEAWQEQFGRF